MTIILEVDNLIKKIKKDTIKKVIRKPVTLNDPRYVAALLGAFMTRKGKSTLIT